MTPLVVHSKPSPLRVPVSQQQAKAYVKWATTRDREPIKDITTIQGALNKWIIPVIGYLPLANINNMTIKPLVDKMKQSKSLSACSINKYVDYVKQVVASLRDGETGEPIHRRKWDSAVMDLPLVNQRDQRRPSLKAPIVNQLVKESEGDEQAVYVLEGATGMRISEALALEVQHFVNSGRTIVVCQQVSREGAWIVPHVKTDAAFREVDLYTPVAEYLRSFIDGKDGLLFKTRNGTPHLHNNLEGRWLTPQAMGLDVPGMGWHAFKRFRKTWLRGKRCQEDVNNFWMAHKPKTMSELYSHMSEELELRLTEAEQVGVGFDVPAYVAPKCSKKSVELEVAVAA